MAALEDRIEVVLRLGRHSEVLGELETQASDHPLRERLQGQLMLALYRSGRQAEASATYHLTRERLVEATGMEPGPELQRLLKQILNQDSSLSVETTPPPERSPDRTNLPLQLASFVGRKAEIDALQELVSNAWLVTLTGAGGIGKTRLALEVANAVIDDFVGGVWLLELAPIADPELVPQVLLSTLGLREQPGKSPAESLVSLLEPRHFLLVLDNCEHLAEATARMAEALLKGCPRMRVLAASREVLGVGGEITFRVPSMATPVLEENISRERLGDLESVELFIAFSCVRVCRKTLA